MELIHNAVYHIKNKAHGGYLAFENGYHIDHVDNFALQTDLEADGIDYFKQLWICVKNDKKDGNGEWRWKLRCVQSGGENPYNVYFAAADLSPGYLMRSALDSKFGPNGSSFVKAGRQEDPSPKNDVNDTRLEWILDFKDNGNEFKIQHAGSRELLEAVGYTKDGIIYAGSSKDAGRDNQLWQFERRSRKVGEIDKLFKESRNFDSDITHYRQSTQYLTLPPSIRQDIWAKSLLKKKYLWTPHLFDDDDNSFAMKAEVSKWQYENLRSHNVSILVGIAFGETEGFTYAFNFFFSQDMENFKLYQPQNGDENPELEGYKLYFALY